MTNQVQEWQLARPESEDVERTLLPGERLLTAEQLGRGGRLVIESSSGIVLELLPARLIATDWYEAPAALHRPSDVVAEVEVPESLDVRFGAASQVRIGRPFTCQLVVAGAPVGTLKMHEVQAATTVSYASS